MNVNEFISLSEIIDSLWFKILDVLTVTTQMYENEQVFHTVSGTQISYIIFY